jgi:predicted helicase
MLADMIDQRELVRAGDIDTDAKTLASHIGLAKAMREYKLNRVISFHSRIKSAKTFAEEHPKIREWMKEPNIKSTNLTTLTISGQDSSDARKRVLDQLKEVDINSQGLVTNARCLTEGVDVPTLDGIAFIDPRASQVDIVQAVGRAIRKSGDKKKFGYIVIPIFFSQEEIDEEIINESAFKPIWDVINALKSHDSKLAEEIDKLRIEIGRLVKPKNISEKIFIDIPKEISIDFTNKINTFLIEKVSNGWFQYYGAMLDYCEKFEELPSVTFVTESGIKLGSWKSEQKKSYKKQKLSKDRIRLLNDLPLWSWNEQDDKWSYYFNKLVI